MAPKDSMTQRIDNADTNQPPSQLNRQDETLRSGLTDMQMFVMMHHYKKSYGDAALPEAEIRQKIEIELAFQDKLVSAFDKEGYFVEDFGASDERGQASIRRELENEPGRALFSWRCFRIHSKDASAPFWLIVWLFRDKSAVPRGLSFISNGWQALDGGDDVSESASPKVKDLEGMSFRDAAMPHRCHLLVIDERLRFETLPLPVMRATLLDGHLAEDLASKVRMAFERIRAKIQVETIQSKKTINCPVCDGKGKMALTFLPDDINRISINHFDMTLPGSMREADQVAIYLCRKLTGLTLQQIADTFGKTHTAVIHACKVVQDRMQAEPEFGAKIISIVHALVSCHMRRSWKTALELLL